VNFLTFFSESWAALVNHLWQSTVVVAIAWALALTLRKNPARVRYWVWMTASVKFLVPFSLLIAVGEWIRSMMPAPVMAQPAVASAMEQVTQPFGEGQIFGAMPVETYQVNWLSWVLLAVWACGTLVVSMRFGRAWWKAHTAKRAATPLQLAADVPVLSSRRLAEPGIFGIVRPVLLLPEGILERLSADQMRAIVAHEMCHMRRRDNLTFAIHTIVKALFWFYPVVWWIEVHLIDEREHACDEAVTEAGGEARAYAEGILNVCKFYVGSPPDCVAGVKGGDLKERIVRIMTERVTPRVNLSRKLLLGAAGLSALVLPIIVGLIGTRNGLGQSQTVEQVAATERPKFDVASIRLNTRGDGSTMRIYPDRITATNMPLYELIRIAYGVRDDQITGGPAWTRTDRYDIEATGSDLMVPAAPGSPVKRANLMLQTLLEDRFQLKVTREVQEAPVYELWVAKGGVKMPLQPPGSCVDMWKPGTMTPGAPPPVLCDDWQKTRMGDIAGVGITMATKGDPYAGLIAALTRILGRTVIDKTGLTGVYEVHLKWTPDMAAGSDGARNAGPADDTGPSIFTAVREQLGLELKAAKGPVTMLVVDSAGRPSAN
jgi:bla regulator protein blaR1